MTNTIKPKNHKIKADRVQITSIVVLTFLTLIILIPFWNAVMISFNTSRGYTLNPFALIPTEFTLDNYRIIFGRQEGLLLGYKGSLIVSSAGTLLSMLVTTMAAYAFSRPFPGRKVIFRMMLITMYFGGGLVPTYLLMKSLRLMNTYTGVILISLVSSYNVIIMKNGFQSIPMELQESAMIDGASDLIIFSRIMLPLQKPMIATFTLFTIVGYWNSWYWPMLIFNIGSKSVLQLFLRAIVNNPDTFSVANVSGLQEMHQFTMGIKMAAVILVMLPVMCIYPFAQKYFAKGIMVGAVKM